MGGYLMFAHFGSACDRSNEAQWRYARSRHSSMNSGSFFLAEMIRIVSSLSPLGTLSSSSSVTKPHLYSRCARSLIVFRLVLIELSRSHGSPAPDFPAAPGWQSAASAGSSLPASISPLHRAPPD